MSPRFRVAFRLFHSLGSSPAMSTSSRKKQVPVDLEIIQIDERTSALAGYYLDSSHYGGAVKTAMMATS